MGHDRHRCQFLLMDELREIVDVTRHRIVPGRRPRGIAMATQVRGDYVVLVTQRCRDPVPTAAMVAAAVQEHQRWRGGIAPIDIMQPQPLREIYTGRRAGRGQIHLAHSKADACRRGPVATGREPSTPASHSSAAPAAGWGGWWKAVCEAILVDRKKVSCMTAAVARLCVGRVHYAWIALTVAFTITLGAVGVRAAPGVM